MPGYTHTNRRRMDMTVMPTTPARRGDPVGTLEVMLENMTADNWYQGAFFYTSHYVPSDDAYVITKACLMAHVGIAAGLTAEEIEEVDTAMSRRVRAVKYLAKAIKKLGLNKRGEGDTGTYGDLVVGVNDDSQTTFEDATLIVKHALELAREEKG
jgi:hypothetical protein